MGTLVSHKLINSIGFSMIYTNTLGNHKKTNKETVIDHLENS